MYKFCVFYSSMRCPSLYFLCTATLLILISSCVTAPDFPDEPVITFTGLSRTMMDQGALNQDSIVIFFSFTDGDGDLGIPEEERSSNNFDLFVIDTRTGNIQDKFALPYVPPKGASNGISGNARVVVFSTCCIYEDGSSTCEPNEEEPTDSIVYEIYVIDRSGNESNRILTSPITINCI